MKTNTKSSFEDETGTIDGANGDGVSTLRPKVFGWLSVALGTLAIAAPATTARLIGARRCRTTTSVLRSVGARELGAGVGLLAGKRPAAGTLWFRVLGDAIDLSLLFAAMGAPRAKRNRLIGAVGAIAGIALLDVAAATMQAREEQASATV